MTTELILIFEVGGERFGLTVKHVQEILESPELHFIPRAPGIFPGAVNFHGHILPVVDLAAFLGYTPKTELVRVVVLSLELGALALGVDAAGRIIRLEEEPHPAPYEEKNPYVSAWLEDEGGAIKMIDAAKLLADFEKM